MEANKDSNITQQTTGNPPILKRGFTKENMKRLIFAKPTGQDWLIFFMLVMILFLAWRYNVEISAAKESCQPFCSICYQNIKDYNSFTNLSLMNLTELNKSSLITYAP